MPIEDYPHPALTADVVLFAVVQDHLEVLLIQRDQPPFEHAWAFPGGFVDLGEQPEDAACRELAEETSIRDVPLQHLGVFGDPRRDPRGHVVSVVYLAVVPMEVREQAEAGSDAAQARWWSVDQLPSLAFDHTDILTCALRYLLRGLSCILEETELLPGSVKLGQLRTVGEMIKRELSDNTRCA